MCYSLQLWASLWYLECSEDLEFWTLWRDTHEVDDLEHPWRFSCNWTEYIYEYLFFSSQVFLEQARLSTMTGNPCGWADPVSRDVGKSLDNSGNFKWCPGLKAPTSAWPGSHCTALRNTWQWSASRISPYRWETRVVSFCIATSDKSECLFLRTSTNAGDLYES